MFVCIFNKESLCPERISHQKRGAQKHFPRLDALRVDFSVKIILFKKRKKYKQFLCCRELVGIDQTSQQGKKNAYMSTKGFF